MGRAVVQITLIGLLFALASTLPNKDDWDIYSFHINSTVTSRYATTVITSRVANRMDESKEIEFHVRIPKNAFISKFRMFIDGQVYDGVVKAKEQAQQQYTEAVSRGESAGLVSSVGRTLEEFKTSVTVAAHKKVTFELTYEELMKRTHGKYELQIHARPMQPVRDFKVDVHIQEEAGISFIDVKGGLSTKALANAITKTHIDKEAWVYFYPTVDQQKMCDSCSDQGMNGDLVIVYDVNRDNGLGHIKKSDGYFVHHFAPSDLPRIPKNVVFVIDQSGSMRGRKILQHRATVTDASSRGKPNNRMTLYEQALGRTVGRKNSLSTGRNLRQNQAQGRAAICREHLGREKENRTKTSTGRANVAPWCEVDELGQLGRNGWRRDQRKLQTTQILIDE